MTDHDTGSTTNKKPLGVFGVLWRGALICLLIFVMVTSCFALWYIYDRQQYLRELDETVAAIKADGYPLDVEELEKYYYLPEGKEDLTNDYLQILQHFQRSTRPSDQQMKMLPYIGAWEKSLVGPDWDHRQLAVDYLKDYQAELEQLRALAQRDGAVRYPVKFADNIAADLSNVQKMRDAARHLSLDCDLALADGDRVRAFADLVALFKTGETLRNEPILISMLVRIALFSMFCKQSEEFLAEGKATPEELATLEQLVDSADFHEGLKRSLVGERSFGYLALNSLHADELGQLTGGGSPGVPRGMGTLINLRPGDAAYMLQRESDMIAAADLDFPQCLDALRKVEDQIKADATAQSLPWNKNIFANLLLPAVSAAGDAAARAAALRNCLRVALAVERFHLKTGQRPATLEELVPDYLPALPHDPFNGQPLMYVVADEEYTIYSVGRDRFDDGGLVGSVAKDDGIRVRTKAIQSDDERSTQSPATSAQSEQPE